MGIFQGGALADIIHHRPHIRHTMQQRSDASDDIAPPDGDPPGPEAYGPDVARLPGTAAQLIGERMRAMYATLVAEPVPDQLLELVRQLENKERSE